jgi:hypothetical protein
LFFARVKTSTNYDIGVTGSSTFLPGGDWQNTASRNHLPANINSFIFLQVNADLQLINGNPIQVVYIPCYFEF